MAQQAEAVGFDSLWAIDRLLFRSASGETYGGWECWSLMAALAAVTNRVELGQLVTNNLFRNPALLAKMTAAVDEISGGCLVLGLGAGDGGPDTGIFGFADDHRVGRFEEAIQIVRGLLRTGHVDFQGRYYQVRDCEVRPRGPRPDGPPIMIGSELGPRMLRLTAQYADLWNTALPLRPEDLATAMQPLDTACAAAGRDPARLGRSLKVPVDLPGRRHPPSIAYPGLFIEAAVRDQARRVRPRDARGAEGPPPPPHPPARAEGASLKRPHAPATSGPQAVASYTP